LSVHDGHSLLLARMAASWTTALDSTRIAATTTVSSCAGVQTVGTGGQSIAITSQSQ
jgi:hypothetical protein